MLTLTMKRVLVALAIVLGACSGGGENNDAAPSANATPVPVATLTFEERLAFPAGQVENPIQMLIHPVETVALRLSDVLVQEFSVRRARLSPDATLADDLGLDDLTALSPVLLRDFGVALVPADTEALTTLADLVTFVQSGLGDQLEETIAARSSLYVDVLLIDEASEALNGLCESGTGLASAPWLDGLAYAAAMAQNCGQPALQVASARLPVAALFPTLTDETPEATAEATADSAPEATPEPLPEVDPDDLRTGEAVVLFSTTPLTSITSLADRVFCRLNSQDVSSWFVPLLLMEQVGLDPLRAPAEIRDVATADALVAAVAEGECEVAALPEGAFSSAPRADGVSTVTTTTPFPFGVLVYPLEVQLGVRLSLNENLIAIAADPAAGRPLRLLLGADALLPAAPDDFAEMTGFIAASGYDLAQLGN
ncbi:MAG: hypothetical protein OHK0046_02520 [Anaerolineae bacterium]